MDQFWHVQIHPNEPEEAEEWAKKSLEKRIIGLDIGVDKKEKLSLEDQRLYSEMYEKALSEWSEYEWKKWNEWHKKFGAGPKADVLKNFIDKSVDNAVVLVRAGNKPIALVKVISPYYFEPDGKDGLWFRHRRKIKVLDRYENFKRNFPQEISPPSQKAFDKLNNPDKPTYKFIKRWLAKINREVYMEHIKQVLNKFHQVILYGPPGAGKTYLAKKVAARMLGLDSDAGVKKNHPQYKNFQSACFGSNESDSEAKGKWAIVQFHPSYNYEDFVRGIKIVAQDERIIYKAEDRIFAQMCREAESNVNKNYVLIIDEINRANLAAVLGELIYALEYRGEAVKLSYEGEELKIPENLYIIGTMNTADRSIGHIDYAVRRRFVFVQTLPDRGVVEHYEGFSDDSVRKISLSLFDAVERLFKRKEGEEGDGCLSTDYYKEDVQPGHSYFLAKSVDELTYKFAYQVLPLLKEYCKDGVLVCEDCKLFVGETGFSLIREISPDEVIDAIKSLYSGSGEDRSEQPENSQGEKLE